MHSHPHHQPHHHAHHGPHEALRWAAVCTGLFMIVEAVVGVYSGSLALLADAGHMLSDTGSLVLALFAQVLANRSASKAATFGYRRAEVLAAFANGIVLALIAFMILKESIMRWFSPSILQPLPVLLCAALGLVLNLLVAKKLHHGAHSNENVRAALMHVLSDAVGSVGVLLSAALVYLFAWQRADAVTSAFIAILIAWSGWRILQRTAGVLLESVPPEVDLSRLHSCIQSTPGVLTFHDLHVWRISEGFDVVSVHITLKPDAHGVEVCQAVRARIAAELGIEHVTVQPEAAPPNEWVALRQRRDGPVLRGR